MRLTGKDVEDAFVETAREQENGDAFNWPRVADLLNSRLAKPRREFAEPGAIRWGER